MSDTERYDLTDADYSQARADARDRAAYQWESPTRWHFWKTYHSEINPDFFDPWFESEISGPTNIPSTGEGDTAYKMTVNLYYCYCWFKYKGYNKYSFCAMMASAVHESHISGGLWEGYLKKTPNGSSFTNKHPYSDITQFEPTSLSTEVLWSTGGTYPTFAGDLVTWTATYTDFRGFTWGLTASSGTWACVKQYPLKLATYRIVDHGNQIMPVGSVEQVSTEPLEYAILPPGRAHLEFNTDAPFYTGDGRGYGMCQWTPWTKFPRTLEAGYSDYHIGQYKDAAKHWQMSGTMHLMMWELERYINGFDYGGLIPGAYLGQWINSNPNAGDQDHKNPSAAYFMYPYDGNHLDQSWKWFMWTSNITWDQYARGDYLAATDNLIEYADQFAQQKGWTSGPMTSADAEWCRRQMALGIYRSAFLQAYYADFGFQEITDYIMRAWNYWDQHPIAGDQGWSVMDIPRPRDIPYCELDMYHIEFPAFFANKKRRRKHGSTILF